MHSWPARGATVVGAGAEKVTMVFKNNKRGRPDICMRHLVAGKRSAPTGRLDQRHGYGASTPAAAGKAFSHGSPWGCPGGAGAGGSGDHDSDLQVNIRISGLDPRDS